MKKTTLKHMKTTPSSCLAKVSLFKEEESKTRGWGAKDNDLTR